MGWKEGTGIGKRSMNTTALKVVKRQDGLGLGAKREIEGGQSDTVHTFSAVLANLHAHHGTDKREDRKKKKRRKEEGKEQEKAARKRKGLVLPQNKVTAGHAQKMRLAKFGEKTADDLACIFGNKSIASVGGAMTTMTATNNDGGSSTTVTTKSIEPMPPLVAASATGPPAVSESSSDDAGSVPLMTDDGKVKSKKDKSKKDKDKKKSKKRDKEERKNRNSKKRSSPADDDDKEGVDNVSKDACPSKKKRTKV
jgi:hypothetical protein